MAHIFGFLIVWAVFWILFFLNVPGGQIGRAHV